MSTVVFWVMLAYVLSSKMFITTYNTICRHNPEDHIDNFTTIKIRGCPNTSVNFWKNVTLLIALHGRCIVTCVVKDALL